MYRRRIGAVTVLRTGDYLLMGHHKNKQAWELPGGKVDDYETILEAAHRELLEETTYEGFIAFRDYVDIGDEHLVMLFTGTPKLMMKIITSPQPNPEAHKFHEWRWHHMSHISSSEHEPAKLTWLAATAITKVTGMLIPSSKILPCPFKRLTKPQPITSA